MFGKRTVYISMKMRICRKWNRFSNHGVLRFFSKSAVDEFNDELAETFGSTPPVTLGESGPQKTIDNESSVPRMYPNNERFLKHIPMENNEEIVRIDTERESR